MKPYNTAMNKNQLISEIKDKGSFLCVGLDTDIDKIPEFLKEFEDPIFEFNKRIIDATKTYCVAFKLNIAFYECLGPQGWESLKKTIDYIPKNILTIADAKRGDIDNTASMYAKTFFKTYDFDAVTIAPYMGLDSVAPFTAYQDKWTIVLALTSNPGAKHFQFLKTNSRRLYQTVIDKVSVHNKSSNTMFVVGATRGRDIAEARKCAPDHFFLVPGIGKQGGSLEEVVKYGFNADCGLLVSSSRGIIYALNGRDFDVAAGNAAKEIRDDMAKILDERFF